MPRRCPTAYVRPPSQSTNAIPSSTEWNQSIRANWIYFETHPHTAADLANRSRYLWIPAIEMFPGIAAPVLTTVGAWATQTRGWALRNAVTDGIITDLIPVPTDWTSGTVAVNILYWAPGGANNIKWDLTGINIGYGNTEPPTGAADFADVFTSVATANLFNKTAPTGLTVVADSFMKFAVDRQGNHIDDSCTVEVYVAGLLLVYTADS